MRGRVVLRAGDTDVELRLDTNALCRVEELSGRSVVSVIDGMTAGGGRLSDLRLLVMAAAGLETAAEAGQVIGAAGLEAAAAAVGKAVEAAFPAATDAAKKKAAAA